MACAGDDHAATPQRMGNLLPPRVGGFWVRHLGHILASRERGNRAGPPYFTPLLPARHGAITRRGDGRKGMISPSDHLVRSALREQRVDLESLIDHRESVDAAMTVESVYDYLQHHEREYLGVTENGQAVGLVSRGRIGFLLGARYGFAVHARQPIREHLLAGGLLLSASTPLPELLERALSRGGEEFYDDVLLTDTRGGFLGVIQVQTLVRLQTRLIAEKTNELDDQRKTLAERNRALTESLDELRRSRGRYGILFQNSVLGVALLNRFCEVESHNQRFAVLLGQESGNQHLNVCDLILPAERQTFLLLVKSQEGSAEEEYRQAMTHSGEFRFLLPRLGIRQFKVFIHWIRETNQFCVLLEDVSEQRILERTLAQKEKANLIESLVGGIAHELNNKLTPIQMFAEFVIEDVKARNDPATIIGHCDAMSKCATEAARIIRQLLQLSKPCKMELTHCDLREIANDAITLLKHRIRQADVTVELASGEPPAYIMADAQQIKQVIVNLVLNSLDAMEGTQRRCLSLSLGEEGNSWIFVVTDTGCGIAPEHLSRVFDPFYTTKAPDRGTGLGLSVCYNIVKQHEGELTLQSTPGVGTQVRVKLMAATNPPPSSQAASPPPSRLAPAAVTRPRRALIVDDEDSIAVMLRTVVQRKLGCRAEWVADGETAIRRLQAEPYDLIISDVRMPHFSGFDLFQWVQKHQPLLASRFIFITGDAGSINLNDELDRLGAPVLRKPFALEAFLGQCQLLLQA